MLNSVLSFACATQCNIHFVTSKYTASVTVSYEKNNNLFHTFLLCYNLPIFTGIVNLVLRSSCSRPPAAAHYENPDPMVLPSASPTV